jgi:dipeptide/tripeptide permease
VLALMLVFVFAVFYSDIELAYKIGIAVLVFSIIFLTTVADQAVKQEEEKTPLTTINPLYILNFGLELVFDCEASSLYRLRAPTPPSYIR